MTDPGLRGVHPTLIAVLESAARLQELVPDAVLVGGTAAALHAGHRLSLDHDRVLSDLRDRFDMVLEALESQADWVTNRTTHGKIILGELGGIEAGVRQLIRRRPLEVQVVHLPSGADVRVPTLAETLRIKAFLMVKRNQLRDYLDVAALAEYAGIVEAANVLSRIDDYYTDEERGGQPMASQVLRQLGNPRPKDRERLDLPGYKALAPKWRSWSDVRQRLEEVAAAILTDGSNDGGTHLPQP